MNRVQVISIGSVVLLALGLAGGKSVAAAVPEPKLLTGVVWQRMFADAKVTYILAVAQRILCGDIRVLKKWQLYPSQIIMLSSNLRQPSWFKPHIPLNG